MSESAIVPEATAAAEGPISFSLEIRGGRTGFRRRPIIGDRFLIGSDATCDLRLEGRLAAPLHCLVRRDGPRLEVDRLSSAPIAVNGAVVEHAELAEGDILGIGPVRLVIHSHLIRFDVVRATDEDVSVPFETASPAEATRHAGARTAEELASLIEAEEERIREFEDRRRAGATALLDAVRSSKRPAGCLAETPPTPADAIVARLGRMTANLAQGSRLRDEQEIAEAADALLAAQRELLGQADRLLRLAKAVAETSRSVARAA